MSRPQMTEPEPGTRFMMVETGLAEPIIGIPPPSQPLTREPEKGNPYYGYDCIPFEFEHELLGSSARRAFEQYQDWNLLDTDMVTIVPYPNRNPSYDSLQTTLLDLAEHYRRRSRLPLRALGVISRGRTGTGRLEVHLLLQQRPVWHILKQVFRRRLNVKVTGKYGEKEQRPTAREKRNRPPHPGCLIYVANHQEYPGCEVVWLGAQDPAERARKKARQRTRRSQRRNAPLASRMSPNFGSVQPVDDLAWDWDDDDL